jgi:hypothetical protein
MWMNLKYILIGKRGQTQKAINGTIPPFIRHSGKLKLYAGKTNRYLPGGGGSVKYKGGSTVIKLYSTALGWRSRLRTCKTHSMNFVV